MTPRVASSESASDGYVALYRRALELAAVAVCDIQPNDWAKPTPCAGWDVRSLVNHLIAGNLSSAQAMQTGTADGREYSRDNTGAEPSAAFVASARACAKFWTDDVPLDRVLVMPYGAFPARAVIGVSLLELLVHTWDIGRARSIELAHDEALCERALRFARKLPAELRLGDSPPYRAPVDVNSTAPAADRLAAFLGRQPNWNPESP